MVTTEVQREYASTANNCRFRDVIIKLLAFTLAMIVIPIGSYFVTINTIFGGEYYNLSYCNSHTYLHSSFEPISSSSVPDFLVL